MEKANKKAIELGCYYDPDTFAEPVINWIESNITLSTTGELISLYPFQKQFIRLLFGWRLPDGRRRFKRALLTSGKKSWGKTVLMAALSLWFFLEDGVKNPKVLLAAVTKDQSNDGLFKEIAYAVDCNEELQKKIKLKKSQTTAELKKGIGTLKSISSDAAGKGGANSSHVFYDEVALSEDKGQLWEQLKGCMKARKEPIHILATNAGWDKAHFYYTEFYTPMKAVLDNESDDITLLPCINELPEELDWKNKDNWHLANPGLQTGLLDFDAFEMEYNDALRSKAGEIWFRRFVCNQFVSTRDGSFINLDDWDKCRVSTFPNLKELPLVIGVDLSSSGGDLTSIVGCWRDKDNYYFKSWNYVPKAAVERRIKQNLKEFNEFALNGDLTIEPGKVIDYEIIREKIKAICKLGELQTIVFDQKFAGEVSQNLLKAGYPVNFFHQYASYYTEPIRKFQNLVTEHKAKHDGNLCLRFCLNNTQLKEDTKGLVSPVRSSEASKIDASCALLMALSQSILHVESTPNYYDSHGIQFI